MAFIIADLAHVNHVNGYNYWRYDTLEASTAVDANDYFNNSDDDQIFRVGDILDVVDWTTAVRTGTIAGFSRHIVVSVSAAGVVDISDDIYNASFADSD